MQFRYGVIIHVDIPDNDDNDAVIAHICRYVTLKFIVSDTINALGI